MTRQNITDILCIGAQRSMTTWLHHVLAAHPQTSPFPDFGPVTSTAKEAHFWDWNRHRGVTWYRRLMRPLNDGHQSLDFTPEYAFLSDDQIAECKALNPTAKVIYILRDPLARALSAIRMHTLWAVGDNSEDHLITYDSAFLERCKNARIWQHTAYCENIARWRRAYPDMLILNFESLSRDPVAGAKDILAHCDLPFDDLDSDVQNQMTSRAQQVIWKTPPFSFHADCLHFLNGLQATESERLSTEFGITFEEGNRQLEAIQ